MEAFVEDGVTKLRLVIEAVGAILVGVGFLVAIGRYVQSAVTKHTVDFVSIRLVLAKYLSLALEFQLGADILSTAVAPTWDQIGKLAAIAVIRTGLNYFLTMEMRQEENGKASERSAPAVLP